MGEIYGYYGKRVKEPEKKNFHACKSTLEVISSESEFTVQCPHFSSFIYGIIVIALTVVLLRFNNDE